MYFIYVLKSLFHSNHYIGITNNIERRFKEHNNGKCKYTRTKMPWAVIYTEIFKTRVEAVKREKFLKSGHGRDFLDKKLNKNKQSGVV